MEETGMPRNATSDAGDAGNGKEQPPGDEVLDPRLEEVAQALSSGATQKNAAKKAGLTARTVRRWLANPRFRARVDQLTRERNAQRQQLDYELADEATEFLRQVMRNQEVDMRLRVRVAEGLLRGHRLGHVWDVRARVDDLEAQLRSLGMTS